MEQQNARPRSWWGMAIVALLLGAPAMFLWLGRWRTALCYFAVEILAAILIFLTIVYGFLPIAQLPHGEPSTVVFFARLPISVIGFLHALRLTVGDHTRPWYARWYISLPAFPVVSVALAFLIRVFLFQPFNMPSGSGVPNLLVGDYFFVSKFAYKFAEPERGDIVTFKKPSDTQTDYIKRIVGLPGDRIQMKSGRLYINGAEVERSPYEPPSAIPTGDPNVHLRYYRETLPEGPSYVIAEVNDRGPFDDTAEFEVPTGHYFMMGDNRDYSSDSRIQVPDGVGYVPRQNITGRYAFRFWNSKGIPLTGRP